MSETVARRGFLKGLVGTLAVSTIPASTTLGMAPTLPAFDVGRELGMVWQYTGTGREFGRIADDLIAEAILDARDRLPAGTRFDIRAVPPMDYGRTFGIAWYRHPELDQRDDWASWVKPYTMRRFDEVRGVYMLGEQTA